MPTYQYRCTSCGEDLEVVQKFTDAALTVCPQCDGELRKVFSPVGVVFKGSGFYATDSRSAKKTSSVDTSTSETARSSTSSEPTTTQADTSEKSTKTKTETKQPATAAQSS